MAAQAETATRWQPWLLTTADELRPASPGTPTRAELAELLDFQQRRSDSTAALVARWGQQPVILPWTNLALDLIMQHKPSPVRAGRALALLHTALDDTVLAVTDAQQAAGRPAPATVDARIEPMAGVVADAAAFPAAHAAVAGAAAATLTYLFPDEPADRLETLAEDAATTGLWAGTHVRSDIEAGLALGQAVAERAIARGQADGAHATWEGTVPSGEGSWQPTPPAFVDPPLDPLAGSWRPWVLDSGRQFRPAAPPAYGSPPWQAELATVQAAVAQRTLAQAAAVRFWGAGPGTVTPGGQWIEIARDLLVRDGLDLPRVARTLALVSVAIADAFLCWDAKYAYWTARPITADPSLDVLIPTPPFPSYTSGHSTISAAAATVLSELFPDDEAELTALAEEAKESRLWAGIHFPIDNDTGAMGGRLVGRLIVARANGAG